MIEREKLDTLLAKYNLLLVEGRYLRGKDYEDGTVSFESVIDSVFLNNSKPEDVLMEVGKLLNPPKKAEPKKKKTAKK